MKESHMRATRISFGKLRSRLVCCERDCPHSAVIVVCRNVGWCLPLCANHIHCNAAVIAVADEVFKLAGFDQVAVEGLFDDFVKLDTSVWSNV